MSEVLNVLRLMMSRLGSHVCPNGHRVERSDSGIGMEIICPACGVTFVRPGAETFAFNSYGACPACEGLGVRTEVNINALVPDQDKTLERGAVLSWNSGGRRLSMYAAGEQGARLDDPFRSLSKRERDVVFHAPPEKFKVTVTSERTGRTVQLTVNYDNAVAAAQRMLRGEGARTRQLAERFTHTSVCSVCGGTRLRPEALASLLGGLNLAEVCALDLNALREFASTLRDGLLLEIARMTEGLLTEFEGRLVPLLDVGLDYLTLDRTGSTLSTGERQRIELTSTVRANATGMLYVLDEPSVGLHPSNVSGLEQTIHALVVNGNSVIIVEHELELIRVADWVIELGPDAGIGGGKVIAESRPRDLEHNPNSIIGPYLSGSATVSRRQRPIEDDAKYIEIEIDELFNLRDVRAKFPMHRLTGVAGPSGAGKTALVLESLVPALRASVVGDALPPHVRYLETGGVRQVVEINASPIGQNARSTPATYTGAFDEIRKIFASSPLARRRRWKPGHFSFNTREGQCPTCFGLGHIDLDV
jgi:excinuclease ABC subunit A